MKKAFIATFLLFLGLALYYESTTRLVSRFVEKMSRYPGIFLAFGFTTFFIGGVIGFYIREDIKSKEEKSV